MKVETFKIKSWKEKETGIVISENEEWVLINSIPTDYFVDGFKLIRKKFIKKRISDIQEKQIERVLQLKKFELDNSKKFDFKNVEETLKWSEEKYGLFEFQIKDEEELFYGKINSIENSFLIIDMVMSNGTIEKDYYYEFSLNKIRVITFESDYFNSIKLLMNDENKLKLVK